jgi:mannose-6-phosphate isomerase-like protein (cupin superfamily)
MGQDRLIAVNGLENVVIVETPDSIFVSDLETSREVKQIVGELKKEGRKECRLHSTVCESWGTIRLLEETEDSIIKKFELNEHAHAAEWMTGDEETVLVIVSGRAKLEVNDSGFGLDTGQSRNLPPDTRVRIKSLEKTPLVFMTIQKPL